MSAIDNAIKEYRKLDTSKKYYMLCANEVNELLEKHGNDLINGCLDLFIYAFVKGVRFQKKMQGSVRG